MSTEGILDIGFIFLNHMFFALKMLHHPAALLQTPKHKEDYCSGMHPILYGRDLFVFIQNNLVACCCFLCIDAKLFPFDIQYFHRSIHLCIVFSSV